MGLVGNLVTQVGNTVTQALTANTTNTTQTANIVQTSNTTQNITAPVIMAASLSYKYEVLCQTEGTWVQGWKVPTGSYTCTNNASHTVDTGNVMILDRRAIPLMPALPVAISEELSPTQGNYQAQGATVVVPPNGASNCTTITWPYPISLLTARIWTDNTQFGDVVSCYAGPNTTIGTLSQDAPAGANLFQVSQSVIDNGGLGYDVSLVSSAQAGQSLGVITGVWANPPRIATQTPTPVSFAAATPTLVQVSKHTVRALTLGPAGCYVFGATTSGAISIPPNVPVVLQYTNNGPNVKTVTGMVEYLY
jgi:hypothetical protein